MTALLLFLIIIFSGSLFAAAVFQRRFEETIPISVGGIVVVMFLAGMLAGLDAAFYVVLILSGLLLIGAFVWMIVKRRFRLLRSHFLTPAFFLFLGLFLVLIYVNYARPANGFDEFSHWLDTVRAMVSLNDFGTNPQAHTLFASYPPGVSLFQYFLQRLSLLVHPRSGFQEWLCYIAYQTLAFSFVFPLLKKASWRRFLSTAVLLVMVYLAPLVLYRDLALATCWVEPFLGIVTGCGFAMLFARRKMDWCSDIALFVTMFVLVLAKDNGIYFAGFLGIGMLVRLILECRLSGAGQMETACEGPVGSGEEENASARPQGSWKANLRRARYYVVLGITILSILLPQIIWKMHCTGRGVVKSFSQPMDLSVIFNVLLRKDTSWHRTAMDTYFKAFFTGTQDIGTLNLQVSYPVLLLMMVAGLVLVYYLWKRLKKTDRWMSLNRRAMILVAFVMTVIYALGMSVFYIFNFGESGSMRLLSMDRYLRVPYLVMLMMGLILFLSWYQECEKNRFVAFLLALLLMAGITPATSAYAIMSRESVAEQKAFRVPYDIMTEQLRNVIAEDQEKAGGQAAQTEGASAEPEAQSAQTDSPPAEDAFTKVFIVSQGDIGVDFYTLRYCLRPCVSQGWAVITEGDLYEGARLRSPEEWAAELQEFDYVIICHVDEAFIEDYGALFTQPEGEQIGDWQIYAVDDANGHMDLRWNSAR